VKLTLPRSRNRRARLAFRIAACAAVGTAAGLATWTGGVPAAAALLVAGGSSAGTLIATRASSDFERGYIFWNRAAGFYGRHATWMIAAIWYWTVLWVVAATGERGRLGAGPSPWHPRNTPPTGARGEPGGGGREGRDTMGSPGDFARWTIRTGRSWALVLVPLLWILRALDTRENSTEPPPNVYTLY
jgi:hypothetical protein